MINNSLFTLDDFKNRGVTKLAPDCLVRINNGMNTVDVLPNNPKADYNEGIVSASVNCNVDPPGSSTATIEIVAPIYNGHHSYYWRNPSQGIKGEPHTRDPIFVPMMEIEVYFKGRFLSQGEPVYYRSFWGYINNVEDSYSGGSYTITLHCVDMLHWFSLMQINLSPSVISNYNVGGGQKLTSWTTIFKTRDPFTIMVLLLNSMGMDNFVGPSVIGRLTARTQVNGLTFRNIARNAMFYWNKRFQKFASSLRLFGALGDSIGINTLNTGIIRTTELTQADYSAGGGSNFAVNGSFLTKFGTFVDLENFTEFQDSGTMSKLDVATHIKNRIDYEFFQDVTGEFIFKPPFYNVDTKNLMPYRIEPHEIVNSSFAMDPDGLISALEIKGALDPYLKTGNPGPSGFHFDQDLTNRFGLRFASNNILYLTSPKACQSFAVGEMSRINSKAFTGSLTLPGRPELRLGYPVYLPHRDSFHYVTSINHQFTFSGNFTTTLALTSERKKVVEEAENASSSKVLKDYIFLKKAKSKKSKTPPNGRSDKESKVAFTHVSKLLATASSAFYAPTPRSKEKKLGKAQLGITESSIPYTDEEGYRVIGAFPYGRGIVLNNSDNAITNGQKFTKNTKQEDINVRVTGASVESESMDSLLSTQREKGTVNSVSNVVDSPRLKNEANDPVRAVTNMTLRSKGGK